MSRYTGIDAYKAKKDNQKVESSGTKPAENGGSKKRWVIYNKKTGKWRYSDDPGSAEIVSVRENAGDGEKKEVVNPIDWKPWLYSAGGGALAYLLAKGFIDDEDDGKNGKESTWMKILRKSAPYAIGAAGALGGYALSKHAQEDQGKEYAYPLNEDETVSEINEPSGDAAKTLSWAPFAGAGAAAGRVGAMLRYRNNDLASKYLTALQSENAASVALKALDSANESVRNAGTDIAAKNMALAAIQNGNGIKPGTVANARKALAEAQAKMPALRAKQQAAVAAEAAAKAKSVQDVSAAGASFPAVKSKLTALTAEGKPTAYAQKYLSKLQANAAKANPTPGTGVVKYNVGRALNAVGKNVGGKWGRFLNLKGSLLSIPTLLGLGYGARELGKAQSERYRDINEGYERFTKREE